MKNPFYLTYGALVLMFFGWAQYRGVPIGALNEAKRIPKSIRNNPGSSRSTYGYFPGIFGGK